MLKRCFLGSLELPGQFIYRPALPPKRLNVIQTANYVAIQRAPYIVISDATISWEIPDACSIDYVRLYNLYNVNNNPNYLFKGYWGDEYVIKFHELDPPTTDGRLFSLSGIFQVIGLVRGIDVYD